MNIDILQQMRTRTSAAGTVCHTGVCVALSLIHTRHIDCSRFGGRRNKGEKSIVFIFFALEQRRKILQKKVAGSRVYADNAYIVVYNMTAKLLGNMQVPSRRLISISLMGAKLLTRNEVCSVDIWRKRLLL